MNRGDKVKLLAHFIKTHPEGLVLAFVRMKHMANKLVEQLHREDIRAEAIHGNKSQAARERALSNFRAGHSRVLIATDIAARGIDVKGIALVVNYDLPEEPESYVHRIGRTARAGKDGIAIAFCDTSERNLLRAIERLIRRPIAVLKGHPFEGRGPGRGPPGNQSRISATGLIAILMAERGTAADSARMRRRQIIALRHAQAELVTRRPGFRATGIRGRRVGLNPYRVDARIELTRVGPAKAGPTLRSKMATLSGLRFT